MAKKKEATDPRKHIEKQIDLGRGGVIKKSAAAYKKSLKK